MLKATKLLKGLDYLSTLSTGTIRAYKTTKETGVFEITRLGMLFVSEERSFFVSWAELNKHHQETMAADMVSRFAPTNTYPVTITQAMDICGLSWGICLPSVIR